MISITPPKPEIPDRGYGAPDREVYVYGRLFRRLCLSMVNGKAPKACRT